MEIPLDRRSREPGLPARWRGPLAWLVIAAACTLWAARPWDGEDGAGGDAVGLVIARLQATYLVGVARLMGTEGAPLYAQARTALDAGTVGQRQRFVLVAAELAGKDTEALAGYRRAEALSFGRETPYWLARLRRMDLERRGTPR